MYTSNCCTRFVQVDTCDLQRTAKLRKCGHSITTKTCERCLVLERTQTQQAKAAGAGRGPKLWNARDPRSKCDFEKRHRLKIKVHRQRVLSQVPAQREEEKHTWLQLSVGATGCTGVMKLDEKRRRGRRRRREEEEEGWQR